MAIFSSVARQAKVSLAFDVLRQSFLLLLMKKRGWEHMGGALLRGIVLIENPKEED